MFQKENRNMYRVDFADHLLFLLMKLEIIDGYLTPE